jgi:hypothetical protein
MPGPVNTPSVPVFSANRDGSVVNDGDQVLVTEIGCAFNLLFERMLSNKASIVMTFAA